VRIIAIDWSGARRGAGRKIWAAEFLDDTPVEELITGRDRIWVKDYLVDASRQTSEMVVGLDFAFSFPAWFVETQASSIQQLWARAGKQGEEWLRKCNPPLWGRKNSHRCDLASKSHYRRTEEQIIKEGDGFTPKSVFQINGGGAVGTGSIRGMAILHQLSSHFNIWPFDEGVGPMIVEIWPRVLAGRVRKSDELERKKFISEQYDWIPSGWREKAETSEDAFDAIVSACVMQQHKDSIALLKTTSDPIIRLEGWIWRPPRGGNTCPFPSLPPGALPDVPPTLGPSV